jgi:peptidoglycan/LPS O-acetylase OafA/YrhL
MQSENASTQADSTSQGTVRLHYLDTLRVLAVFMVFLFHAAIPFTMMDWQVNNAETSVAASVFFIAFLGPWGMPFFFLLAGATAWFALRRRTARQFAGERVRRLLIPFLVGSVLITPLLAYIEWMSRTDIKANYVRLVGLPPLVSGLPVHLLAGRAAAVDVVERRSRPAPRLVAGETV